MRSYLHVSSSGIPADISTVIKALEMIRETLTMGRGINHPSSLVYALMFASSIHTLRGEAQAGPRVCGRSHSALT
jgi:hypothetical protein